MTALEARLAEVLAEHGLTVGFHCICGADLRDAEPIAPTAHEAHLAAVLAAEVAPHDEQAARQAAQDRAAEKYVLQVDGTGIDGRPLPRVVGPFATPDDAWAWGYRNIRNGKSNVAALAPTAPQNADEGDRQ